VSASERNGGNVGKERRDTVKRISVRGKRGE